MKRRTENNPQKQIFAKNEVDHNEKSKLIKAEKEKNNQEDFKKIKSITGQLLKSVSKRFDKSILASKQITPEASNQDYERDSSHIIGRSNVSKEYSEKKCGKIHGDMKQFNIFFIFTLFNIFFIITKGKVSLISYFLISYFLFVFFE